MLRLRKNTVIVEISDKDRDQVFKQAVKMADGSNMYITKDIEAQMVEDKFFSQTVNIAKVIQVSDDVKNILPGDTVILMVNVDSNPKIVIEKGEDYKRVVIQANTTYHDNDYYTPPSQDKRGGWVWRKGDVDENSFIIALMRNGNFVAMNKTIVVRHSNVENESINTGIILGRSRKKLVTRRVLVAPEGSGYSHGDILLVEDEIVGMFDMSGKLFEYFDTDDVILQKVVNKK